MEKTIGVLAHVDAGKTTFSEQLLYHANAIKTLGRVDHKSSYLDNHDIEKERGITIFSDQGFFSYGNQTYNLIDTPGHVDFAPEMERSIQILDYAIIVISGVEGIEGHTETIWELLKKHKIPVFIFINKIDRAGASVLDVTNDICEQWNIEPMNLENLANDKLSLDQIEKIAESDEELLEEYIQGNLNNEFWLDELKNQIVNRNIYPCFTGSALQDIGIETFIKVFSKLTIDRKINTKELSAFVYKIKYDDKKQRWTYLKILNGELKVRNEIKYMKNSQETFEKITQIRKYSGSSFEEIPKAKSGELVAVSGITDLGIGESIGEKILQSSYDLKAALKSKIKILEGPSIKEVVPYFRELEEEDPSLNLDWRSETQSLNISVMGLIQLEVLKRIVPDRFNIKIDFEEPEILYKETIKNKVLGCGHFEPLKHYAEVHLMLEPIEKIDGLVYENQCHADHLTTGQQNLIGHHVLEKIHKGILIGAPLVGIKCTLTIGRAHNKHTNGGDFREATYRAIRQGLEQADNILLEPYYKLKIKVPIDHIGRVMTDLQKGCGKYHTPIMKGEYAWIEAKAPVSEFMTYGQTLAAFTQGKGSIQMVVDGYDVCHNQVQVLEQSNYDKTRDLEYTSSSVFCSKGQGYVVSWENAHEAMHCELREI